MSENVKREDVKREASNVRVAGGGEQKAGPWPLPEGWVWTTIGEVADIRNGFAFNSHDYQNSGILLIRQSNLGGDQVDLDKAVYLPEEYLVLCQA